MAKQYNPIDDEALNEVGQTALGTSGQWVSPEAKISLEHFLAKYSDKLINEALRLARTDRAQQVSTANVEEANRRILERPRAKWIIKFSGTLGGAFLGCVVAMVINLFQGGSTTNGQVLLMILAAILGTACAFFHAFKS